ncbi:6-phosphogluconolactonase [Arthrobacter crystallopoietes BAB-32]|uniref:6-phosphogluconolactonase n=1 Tax=Arthrobacter crystallopoietes BAB-32 TaxID=1246476 RepID=N1VCA1_9MICC|nr:6-phosphogluconolactonase [Arthrobacter crystallopoietes]EMY35918.1 6-phosphogluconolactonase [Arthrobacter crystallopoietes BAB-32]
MTAEPVVHIHPDADVLTAAAARRLIGRLDIAQKQHGTASVVLTGGTLGINMLRAVAADPSRSDVDWKRVDFWWGDERFVAKDSPDRNELQARKALLDLLDVDEARVHPFGSTDDFESPQAAAEAYASELRRAAAGETNDGGGNLAVPRFDVLLLGMGPDGHIASLFPDMAGIREQQLAAVGVEDSPKPPPQRVSLTLPVINSAEEIWFVVAGEDKACAAGLALAGATEVQVPAAGARGRHETLWLLDQAAAGQLPDALRAAGETF